MRNFLLSLTTVVGLAAATSASAAGCNAETPTERRIAECTKLIETSTIGIHELAMALATRGLARQELGDHERAFNDLNRSVDLQPDDRLIRTHRANAFYLDGNYEAAISDMDWIIHLNPEPLSASFIDRCLLKTEAGDQWGAIQDCEDALRIDPYSENAYNKLAWALYRAGAPAEALNDAEIALAAAPEAWEFLDTRAHILVALGRQAEAVESFQRAAEIGAAETVGLYQSALRAKGYYDGPEDGQWSDTLQEALIQCVSDGCGLLAEADTLQVLEQTDDDFVRGFFGDATFSCLIDAGLAEGAVMLFGAYAKTLITPDGSKIVQMVDGSGTSHIIARDAYGLFDPKLSDAARQAMAVCE